MGQINPERQGESFWVRGYLQSVRAKSKIAFLVLREGMFSIQGVLHEVGDPFQPSTRWVRKDSSSIGIRVTRCPVP